MCQEDLDYFMKKELKSGMVNPGFLFIQIAVSSYSELITGTEMIRFIAR